MTPPSDGGYKIGYEPPSVSQPIYGQSPSIGGGGQDMTPPSGGQDGGPSWQYPIETYPMPIAVEPHPIDIFIPPSDGIGYQPPIDQLPQAPTPVLPEPMPDLPQAPTPVLPEPMPDLPVDNLPIQAVPAEENYYNTILPDTNSLPQYISDNEANYIMAQQQIQNQNNPDALNNTDNWINPFDYTAADITTDYGGGGGNEMHPADIWFQGGSIEDAALKTNESEDIA